MTNRRSIRALVAALALSGLLASPALARTEQMQWQHGDLSVVSGFKIHVGSSAGSYQQTIDVGIPTVASGTFEHDLTIPDGDDIYVAVTAYDGSGVQSSYSNEIFRAAPAPAPTPVPLGQPGQPVVAGS